MKTKEILELLLENQRRLIRHLSPSDLLHIFARNCVKAEQLLEDYDE